VEQQAVTQTHLNSSRPQSQRPKRQKFW